MERHIREPARAPGVTFLIVEHDMHLVMRLCDPVIVLDHGTRDRDRPAARGPVATRASSTPTWGALTCMRDPTGVVAGYGQGDILRGVDLDV